LALFGRRLSEAGQDLGIPASENLHRTGLMQCKIVRSAAASQQ